MATISKLTVGQTLYSVQRQRCGNTTVTRGALLKVKVLEIAPDNQSIMASCHGNPPCRYRERDVAKLRVNRPQPKGTVFGMNSY